MQEDKWVVLSNISNLTRDKWALIS